MLRIFAGTAVVFLFSVGLALPTHTNARPFNPPAATAPATDTQWLATTTYTLTVTVTEVAEGGGGNAFGCTLDSDTAFDPLMPVLILFATFYLWRRRCVA